MGVLECRLRGLDSMHGVAPCHEELAEVVNKRRLHDGIAQLESSIVVCKHAGRNLCVESVRGKSAQHYTWRGGQSHELDLQLYVRLKSDSGSTFTVAASSSADLHPSPRRLGMSSSTDIAKDLPVQRAPVKERRRASRGS